MNILQWFRTLRQPQKFRGLPELLQKGHSGGFLKQGGLMAFMPYSLATPHHTLGTVIKIAATKCALMPFPG